MPGPRPTARRPALGDRRRDSDKTAGLKCRKRGVSACPLSETWSKWLRFVGSLARVAEDCRKRGVDETKLAFGMGTGPNGAIKRRARGLGPRPPGKARSGRRGVRRACLHDLGRREFFFHLFVQANDGAAQHKAEHERRHHISAQPSKLEPEVVVPDAELGGAESVLGVHKG